VKKIIAYILAKFPALRRVSTYVLARLTERSTWVGLTGVISVIGIGLTPAHAETIAMVGAAIASVVQVAVKDRHPAAATVEADDETPAA
jgi:hypothetical protein